MNPMIRTTLVTLIASFLTTPAFTDEQPAEQPSPPKPVCETSEHFNDFDFWLGDWNVYSNDEATTAPGHQLHHQAP